MVFNTKRIRDPFLRNFPERASKAMPLKSFYLSARKREGRSVIARQNCNEIVGKMTKKSSFLCLIISLF